MLILILLITIAYLFLIGSFVYGFDKISDFKLTDTSPKTKFSVVIPFRNESKNLPQLLASVVALNYPKSLFEILFIDDESTDNSVDLIRTTLSNFDQLDVSVVPNTRTTKSPKKDAITTAIALAKYDWIVTTDADCELPKYWLDTFDNYSHTRQLNMLVAPVTFKAPDSFFQRFQLLDILSLQGATIGSFGIHKPFLCNGANLAYTKDFFYTVNGFEGNTKIASGDDIFLLEKAVKHDTSSVQYIKSSHSIVTTQAQPNFSTLKAQRVRWASKTSSYKNGFGKLTGFIVLLMNALLVCLPLLYVLQIISLKTLMYTFSIKLLIDFLLIFKTARFFNQEQYLASYLFSSLIYPFFSVYIAFASMFKGYKWKDRAYSK
ncbi:glycosyltransferase [Psychroserpens algicola]|uniref:glycosyltransferase n=1 Tax=Psychroserpens algicola TaxID=1719034 RepID=UPI00195466E9|nr:glycosyltransferase [Psychroserpens algicola]